MVVSIWDNWPKLGHVRAWACDILIMSKGQRLKGQGHSRWTAPYLLYQWGQLYQILVTHVFAFADILILIRFWGQKVKGQGHSKRRYNSRWQGVEFSRVSLGSQPIGFWIVEDHHAVSQRSRALLSIPVRMLISLSCDPAHYTHIYSYKPRRQARNLLLTVSPQR